MKKLSVFFAAAALVALASVVVGATAGHAGVQGRSGTIAFLRSDAGSDGFCWLVRDQARRQRPSPSHAQWLRYRPL